MTDWQKVKVEFTDADGNEVSAVMYQGFGPQSVCSDAEGRKLWIGWNGVGAPKVTPIRELPTGVGAVIKSFFEDPIVGELDHCILVLTAGREWAEEDGSLWPIDEVRSLRWEVLSEGVQL